MSEGAEGAFDERKSFEEEADRFVGNQKAIEKTMNKKTKGGFIAKTGLTLAGLATLFKTGTGQEIIDHTKNIPDAVTGVATSIMDKAAEAEEIVTGDENIGKPYGDGTPLVLNLQKVEDGKEDAVKPTFRTEPSVGGKELTSQELLQKGLNEEPMDGIITRPTLGGEYAASPQLNQSQVKAEVEGKDYGIWQEILIPTTNFGEYKRSGVYVAGNVVDWETAKPIQVGEGQEIKIIEPQANQQ